MVTTARHWLGGLRQNPIYLREKGGWGQPNPFYNTLMRYSPLLVLAVIIVGACSSFSNPALLAGDDALTTLYCLICLPSMLLTIITLYGTFMAPALTAPLISMERDRGTWEILRVTPQSTRSILLAKLLGALSRLRIWPVLVLLCLLQAAMVSCSFLIAGGSLPYWSWLIGLCTLLRPFLEILFAALAGLLASLLVRAAMTALIAAYTAVFLLKVFNSSAFWLWGSFSFDLGDSAVVISTVGPAVVYFLATAVLFLIIMLRADKLA